MKSETALAATASRAWLRSGKHSLSPPPCREALTLVAIPMIASAISTVITTTPLFAAATLILKRFAAVIFVTMLVGLAYVILFLTPMLAMFGPGPQKKKVIDEETPLHTVVTDLLLRSKGVRFVGVAVIAVLILVRFLSPFSSVQAWHMHATLYAVCIDEVLCLEIKTAPESVHS